MLIDGAQIKLPFPQRKVLHRASSFLVGYILAVVEQPLAGLYQVLQQVHQNKWDLHIILDPVELTAASELEPTAYVATDFSPNHINVSPIKSKI